MPFPFGSLYAHGFARVAVCVPEVRVADPEFNTDRTLELAQQAADAHAVVAVFPELGLSAYSCDDLFHQDALLDEVQRGLSRIVAASADLTPIIIVGGPLRVGSQLFNCAFTVHGGHVIAVTPKSYLPGYREFYEERQFAAARDALVDQVTVLGQRVPFGTDIVVEAVDLPGLVLHTEICEDLWVPVPPSTWAALGGATVLTNLSGSPVTIGKAAYRRELCMSQSSRCVAAYLYAGSGPGESTTDLAWDGHAIITENGTVLAESTRYATNGQVVLADVDLERLLSERARLNTLVDAMADHRDRGAALRRVGVTLDLPTEPIALERHVERFPYVPSNRSLRNELCEEVYQIQVQGLTTRLSTSGIDKVVIGVSGGLDSTQALLVCARVMDVLGLPRTNILAYTMPGYATGSRTLGNALALMDALGVRAHTIDIRPACEQMLRDIEHPFSDGHPVYDITFENVQAGQRTSHLFRLANQNGALVVGTGDLSELALGWCTYGVGDQMSHYNVNTSVPKTLIQYLIRWLVDQDQLGPAAGPVLLSIVDTEISPELVPGEAEGGKPTQLSQDTIGPYELQDFTLYYVSRFGFRPSKVAFLARHAWGDAARGTWPDLLPESERHQYDLATISRWLQVFLRRFFGTSQFKRSAMPNGPKVGSGGSLSPRGDWRAPSDGSAAPWLAELARNVPLD